MNPTQMIIVNVMTMESTMWNCDEWRFSDDLEKVWLMPRSPERLIPS